MIGVRLNQMSITEFKKSLYYAFRGRADKLSRFEFMRAVTQLTALYHKAYSEQRCADKEQINAFVRRFLSQLTHDNTKTPQMLMIDLEKQLIDMKEITGFGCKQEDCEKISHYTDIKTKQIRQAFEDNNLLRLEFLLQTSNTHPREFWRELLQAGENDNFEALDIFFKNESNVEIKKLLSTEVLIQSVEDNNIPMARQMIAYGADVNVRTGKCHLLGCAILKTKPEIIKLLLEAGADVTLRTKYGNSLLHLTAGYYHDNPILPTEKLIQMLITKGLDVDVKGMAKHPPLFHAVAHNNYPAVKALLKMYASVFSYDIVGNSVLHHAVMHRDNAVAVIEELLKAGADINARNHWGRTPLFSAIKHEMSENVRILLNNGAKSSISDYEGITPLKCAIKQTRTGLNKQITNTRLVEIIEMLKAHNPSIIQKAGKVLQEVKKLFEKSR